MKTNRQYQGVQLSKKESELVAWLQKGEHTWQDAFYMYSSRKKPSRIDGALLKERSWFNHTLASLQKKGLCKNIAFVFTSLPWRNPGIKASKSNFVALTVQEVNLETKNKRVL